MAIYTTFFAATAEELEVAFPGWLKPLAKPVKKTSINPFTKQPVTYDSWEPDEALHAPAPVPAPRPVVVAIQGDYTAYLHDRLPTGMHALPKLAAKGVLSPHVEQLLAAVAKRPEERLVPALFPPGGSAGNSKTLDALPDWGVAALAGVPDEVLPQLGEQLVQAKGWFADEKWAAKDCIRLLGELRSVALKAREGQRALYLFTEV